MNQEKRNLIQKEYMEMKRFDRNDRPPGEHISPSFMSTIMYKVGHIHNNFNIGNGEQLISLTSMADGWTRFNHFIENEEGEDCVLAYLPYTPDAHEIHTIDSAILLEINEVKDLM